MSGYAGTLPGSLSADNSGGVSYVISIDVPPGTAGAAPQLSLSYSSLAGNGPLGVGWNLAGLSVIERTASTLAQDPFLAGITFTDTDRLALDQSRLVPRSGSAYFGTDTVYETEIQSWHRVVPIYLGTPGRHGPDAFEVTQRDGRVFRYGTTPDSQGVVSAENPSIRAWYLSSITDLRGNTIEFSYVDGGAGGVRMPSVIAYTSNGTTGARRFVRFKYGDRADVEGGFLAGYEIRNDLRLEAVETFVDDRSVSSYALAYEYGAATGRSRLVSITRADGSSVALPPTVFEWQEATPNFGTPSELDVGGIEWGGSLLPMDIDGDGRVDFVNAYEGTSGELCLTIYLAQADGSFAPAIPVEPPGLAYGGQIVTLDANGDGRMELVYAANNEGVLGLTMFTAASHTGDWTLVPGPLNGAGPSGLIAGGTLVAADVDGDGMADLVNMSETSGGLLRLQTLFSDGTSFTTSATDKTAPTALFGGDLLAGDTNADGMDDLVYAVKSDGGASWQFTLYRSTGRTGFVESVEVLDGTVPSGGQLIPLDVNADGNTDVIHVGADPEKQTLVARVLVNDGLRFKAGIPVDTGLPFGGLVLPASLTASASPEILVLTHDSNNSIVVSAFRTSATELTAIASVRQPPAGTVAGGNAMPLDLRGVGFSDLVYAVDSGGSQKGFVMPALGPYPDLMVSAANGVGGRYTATFAPLTDATVYESSESVSGGMEPRSLLHSAISGASYAAGATPRPSSVGARHVLQRTPIPKYVVATTVKSDGLGNSWATSYRYQDALIDHSGRGWLGFGAVESDDADAGTTTRKALHQFFPLTQMLRSSTVTRTSDGGLMTDAQYAYEAPQSGSSYQVLSTSSSTLSYSFAKAGSEPDTELVSATAYDAYGNVTQASTSGSALAAGSVTVQSYVIDESKWQLGELESRVEYSSPDQTEILRQDRLTYDPVTRQVTTHSRWDDVADRWLQIACSYDRFGNLISSTDASGGTVTTSYEPEFNSFPASETTSPVAGTVLTRSFVYEPDFGRAISATDPAGATRTRTIDGLGRAIAEARTAPDGALVEVRRINWAMVDGLLCQQTDQRLDWGADVWTTERVLTDAFGRTVRTERDPAEGRNAIVVQSSYNSNGLKLAETLPHFDGQPSISAAWTYDAFGRVISATTPAADGTPVLTTTTYPRVDTAEITIAAETAYAQTTAIRYGVTGGGRVPVWRRDNAGAITTYSYDGLGRLLTLTDPTGIVTNAEFDTLGRQVKTWIGTNGKVLSARSVVYDDLSRAATESAANRSITAVRDGLHRVIEKRVGSGAVTQFVYDETDVDYGRGRLTTVKLPTGAILRYSYDPDGNVTSRQVTVDGTTATIQEVFLPNGQRASVAFPDGSTQRNSYGPSGKLTSVAIAEPSTEAEQVIGYGKFDALDNPASVAFANGVESAVTYDVYGRMRAKQVADMAGTSLFSDTVARAPTDVVIALGDPSAPQRLDYDPVGRLQSVEGGDIPPASYAYDLSGNCTAARGTTLSYDGYAATSGVGAESFTAAYDDDGDLVELERDGQSGTYSYDDEQQLVAVSREGGQDEATYSYDHLGHRLTKTENGVVTWYVGPEYEIVRFPDGSQQHSCVVGERGVRDLVITTADHGNPPPTKGIPALGKAFFISDHLKSVRLALDDSGAVSARVNYDPFGAVAAETGSSDFRYRFSGREFDQVAGAYYFGARYYHPELSRFLTPDDQLGGSLIDRDTFNTYAYVLNDPAGLVDSTGHSWWDFVGQIALDVVTVAAGIAVLALTGGAANIVGSTLIGAGIGGLAYDIKAAATGKGADVSWGKWGVQVGIGAATGLITGGVAVGAGSALATAGVQGVAKGFALAGIMAVTASGVGMATTVVNNAISGSSLTSGLGMAGVSGAVVGLLGGGGSAAMAEVFGSGASVASAEAADAVAPEAIELDELPGAAPEAEQGNVANQGPRPANAIDEGAQVGNQAPRPYWRNFVGRLRWQTDESGDWSGLAWTEVRNSSPRLIFGSLRSVIMSSMPDFGKTF